jgi:PTS system mannitol-specific IIC component
MTAILAVLTAGVDVLIKNNLLPLAAIFIEPAKVLFLNNAINHGIFTPIGAEQVKTAGKSIMYMLEANPGPGLGVLLAYWLGSKDKATRDSAPGAIIIHFLGGIHEIYFPYILMNPVVIAGPIVGNICAIFFFNLFKVGLKGPSSPGSIIAFLSMAPKDQVVLVFLGVAIAAAVSFAVSLPILKATEVKGGKSLEDAQSQMAGMKAEAKGTAAATAAASAVISNPAQIKKIIFACDAGMGSSAMGATKFRNRIKAVRPDITVKNTSVDNIPADCDIAVVQTVLAERAKKSCPKAQLVQIGNFLADPALDDLYIQVTTLDKPTETVVDDPSEATNTAASSVKMTPDCIMLNQTPVSKEEAIKAAGQLLVKTGAVEPSYIDAMLEREKLVSTYMGMGIAIPHGTTQAKGTVKKSQIVMIQYPDGVDFGDEKAQLVFGIAGIGDEHLDLLAKIADCLDDLNVLEKMKTTEDKDWIIKTLS